LVRASEKNQHLSDHDTNHASKRTVPTIVIPESIREQILAHAREGAPEEVCGVLSGTENADEHHDEADHRVEVHHPAENVAERPRTRYEIDPREQLELMETIEDAGREVVGFYHSHPEGPAGPSATDSAQATWPGRSYVIVSLEGTPDESEGEAASLGSWRWTGEEFVEESVRVG
jgi:proteasome lid subunit RPN8/RPN11